MSSPSDNESIDAQRLKLKMDQLALERERWQLEKAKAQEELRHSRRNTGAIIIASAVGVATVLLSIANIYIASQERKQERLLAREEKERRWDLEIESFLTGPGSAIFGDDPEQRDLAKALLIHTFPRDNVTKFIAVMAASAQSTQDEGFWRLAYEGVLGLMYRSGFSLSPEELRSLESHLEHVGSDDLEIRTKLLGCYSNAAESPRQAGSDLIRHYEWFLENKPNWPALRHVHILVPRRYAGAWRRIAEDWRPNSEVLLNAGSYLLLEPDHRAEAREYLIEAAEGRAWDVGLQLRAANLAVDKDPGKARHLVENVTQLESVRSEPAWLPLLAELLLALDDPEGAESYAEECLRVAEENRSSWWYGNCIHDSHIVLGRLALQRGEAQEAADHLLAAGLTPGSPQLRSFGPDFELASFLLDRGHEAEVMEYLRRCRRFWGFGRDQLDFWISMLEQGKVPNLQAPHGSSGGHAPRKD